MGTFFSTGICIENVSVHCFLLVRQYCDWSRGSSLARHERKEKQTPSYIASSCPVNSRSFQWPSWRSRIGNLESKDDWLTPCRQEGPGKVGVAFRISEKRRSESQFTTRSVHRRWRGLIRPREIPATNRMRRDCSHRAHSPGSDPFPACQCTVICAALYSVLLQTSAHRNLYVRRPAARQVMASERERGDHHTVMHQRRAVCWSWVYAALRTKHLRDLAAIKTECQSGPTALTRGRKDGVRPPKSSKVSPT